MMATLKLVCSGAETHSGLIKHLQEGLEEDSSILFLRQLLPSNPPHRIPTLLPNAIIHLLELWQQRNLALWDDLLNLDTCVFQLPRPPTPCLSTSLQPKHGGNECTEFTTLSLISTWKETHCSQTIVLLWRLTLPIVPYCMEGTHNNPKRSIRDLFLVTIRRCVQSLTFCEDGSVGVAISDRWAARGSHRNSGR
jgi:hypothetical protein